MASISNITAPYGVSNDLLARSFQNRVTVPLGSSLSTPQRKGSLIFDARTNTFYYSDGANWNQIISSVGDNINISGEDSVITNGEDVTISGGNATGGIGDGGDINIISGTTVGGEVGSLILGESVGQTTHVISTGLAPGVVFSGAGVLAPASTDNCGVVTGLGPAGDTATFTFNTPFPTASTVVVVCSYGTTPTAGADAPFVTGISPTGFTLTNPDGVLANDIHYMVMGCL